MQVFQIKLKYHCSKPIKLQKFLMKQYKNLNHSQTLLYGHPLNTNTSLLRTVCATLSVGKKRLLHLPKFNPLNTDTPLIRALSMTPSVSVFGTASMSRKSRTINQSSCSTSFIIRRTRKFYAVVTSREVTAKKCTECDSRAEQEIDFLLVGEKT